MIEISRTADGARRAYPSVDRVRSPARPALQVASAVDRVRRAPAILEAMHTLPALLSAVDETIDEGLPGSAVLEPLLEAVDDEHDSVAALASIHGLARVPGPEADEALLELILEGAPGYEDHALWAANRRLPTPTLVRAAAHAVGYGSMPAMHAQRALAAWAAWDPAAVLVALETTLREYYTDAARRPLVETMGLVPGRDARLALERVALDANEAEAVRRVAVAAFADRSDEQLPASIDRLARQDDSLGAAVRKVRSQRRLLQRGLRRDPRWSRGVRVAQVHLGRTGGLATLLPQLGTALASRERIAEAITIARADAVDRQPRTTASGVHRLELLDLAPGEGESFGSGWPALVEAAREIRSAFLSGDVPDVMHLRMADPGSFAAAAVARELGIPLVFTFAPDPHGPIAAAEAAGTLGRRNFAGLDARDALWFRADLVERFAHEARELVLFPRPDVRERMHTLTGIDLASGPPRTTIVAEGIDSSRIDRATREVAAASSVAPVLADLQAAIGHLPKARHGLPLLLSVGRLHAVKGMSRLVRAFAADPELSVHANLVIVGGDLDDPTAAEAAELARIEQAFRLHPRLREQVVLLGRRSHEDVALLLAATRLGWGDLIGARGAYVCASAKEEFGLAIVEALAAGLPVVAPRVGGPATYVEDGVTGVLTDTTDPGRLSGAAQRALALAARPETAGRARALVDERYTLDRMARSLTAVYRIASGASALAQPVATGLGTEP